MTSDAEKMTLLLPTTSKIASNVYISFRCQLCWPHYRLDINCGPPELTPLIHNHWYLQQIQSMGCFL